MDTTNTPQQTMDPPGRFRKGRLMVNSPVSGLSKFTHPPSSIGPFAFLSEWEFMGSLPLSIYPHRLRTITKYYLSCKGMINSQRRNIQHL